MDLNQARNVLNKTVRHELRDHAFGDREVTWTIENLIVAEGYFGGGIAQVSIGDSNHFENDDARLLLECGTLVVERNDETGPETFQQDATMPGLTKEGVRKELTGE